MEYKVLKRFKNLLPNGNFEGGVPGWGASTGMSVTEDTSECYSGTKSMRATRVTGAAAVFLGGLAVSYYKWYRVRGKYKHGPGSTLTFRAAVGGNLSSIYFIPSYEWTPFDCVIYLDSGSAYFYLWAGGGVNGDYINFDDISITKVPDLQGGRCLIHV